MFPDSFKIQAKNLRLKRPPDWREREKKRGGGFRRWRERGRGRVGSYVLPNNGFFDYGGIDLK